MGKLKLWLYDPNQQTYEFEREIEVHQLLEVIFDIEPRDPRWVVTDGRNIVVCSGAMPEEWHATTLAS